MLKALKNSLVALERQRMELMIKLLALTPEQRQLRLEPGEWSILEIVQHLVLTEREMAAPIWLAEAPVGRRTPASRVKLGVVLFVLRRRITVPVPSRAMVPNGATTLRAAHQEWQDLRSDLQGFLERVAPERLADAIFSHPIGGPFDSLAFLKLTNAHIKSHQLQIGEILQKHQVAATSAV